MNIKCIETGKIYQSFIDAENETGAYRSSIQKVCTSKRRTAGGLTWEYIKIPQEPVAQKERKVFDRAFTFDTKMMLVRSIEKGETVESFATDTMRSVKDVSAKIDKMKESGEWEKIKKMLDGGMDLPMHEVGRRIA